LLEQSSKFKWDRGGIKNFREPLGSFKRTIQAYASAYLRVRARGTHTLGFINVKGEAGKRLVSSSHCIAAERLEACRYNGVSDRVSSEGSSRLVSTGTTSQC
jgi:hypothetical protein